MITDDVTQLVISVRSKFRTGIYFQPPCIPVDCIIHRRERHQGITYLFLYYAYDSLKFDTG